MGNSQQVNNKNNVISNKLSGGEEANPHEAPWMVSIQRFDLTQNLSHTCGGSILKPHLILTAAHCLLGIRLEVGHLFAGRHNLNESELETQQNRSFSNSDLVIHKRYTPEIGPDDIGLIKLTIPLVMTNYVKTIALPLSDLIPHGSVRLYGWGRTEYEVSGGVLITSRSSVMDNNLCNAYFTSSVLDTNICTTSDRTASNISEESL